MSEALAGHPNQLRSVARRFLETKFGAAKVSLGKLHLTDVTEFVVGIVRPVPQEGFNSPPAPYAAFWDFWLSKVRSGQLGGLGPYRRQLASGTTAAVLAAGRGGKAIRPLQPKDSNGAA